MRILVFGDSITQGFFDREGGWVQRLARQHHRPGSDVEIFNLGVSGDTAEKLVTRIEAETKVRRWPDDPVLAVVSIGINDARQTNHRAVTDVYQYQKFLEKALYKAAKAADQVVCVGLTAVDETQTNPWRYSSQNEEWSNARINAFEDTLKQSALLLDLPFVPIHDQFLAQLEAGADLLADGMHPNEAGHQLIAELVKPALDELIAKV